MDQFNVSFIKFCPADLKLWPILSGCLTIALDDSSISKALKLSFLTKLDTLVCTFWRGIVIISHNDKPELVLIFVVIKFALADGAIFVNNRIIKMKMSFPQWRHKQTTSLNCCDVIRIYFPIILRAKWRWSLPTKNRRCHPFWRTINNCQIISYLFQN